MLQEAPARGAIVVDGLWYFQGERRVRSLNLPQTGRVLIYEPLTKAEREQLAKAGQIQAVPVVIARK